MMWNLIQYIRELMCDNGQPAPNRFYPALAFFFFLAVSSYLAIKGQTWQHYETFSAITGGGALAYLLGNRLINSKYNSEVGKMPDKE